MSMKKDHEKGEVAAVPGGELAILQPYCENGMQLLKRISRSIFMKFNEPLSTADYDDFYSIANMTLWQAYNTYNPDKGISFDGFLRSCLQKKFKTELRYRHRQKRILNQLAVSLDLLDDDDEKSSLLEIIPSDFDTFEEVIKSQENEQYQDKVQRYISRLSNQQIGILNFMMDGYEPYEIRQILKISVKEYTDDLKIIRSYEHVKILF